MKEKNSLEKKSVDKITEAIEKRISLREVINWFSLIGFIYGPLDERLRIREALEKAFKRPIPAHVNWLFCFGGITFFIFIIQAITGTLLFLYYRPTAAEAYTSIQFITNHVPFGWLIRSIHYWGSNLMILTVLIHMTRVFFYRAYRHPRDFNWVAGVFLLLITLSFSFTGSLLSWNQFSYWATTVGTEMVGFIPLLGKLLVIFLRGSIEVTEATLSRFFVTHVLLLPFIITFFLLLHFSMIRKLGIAEPL